MTDVVSGTAAGAIHLTGYQMGRDDERSRILTSLNEQITWTSRDLEILTKLTALIENKGE